MSIKLRSVNTKFWEDPFVEELNPEEKLLFLYFLTNPLTTILGIYEITVKRISYDTGLSFEMIGNAFKRFEESGKIFYINNFIVLPNFLKNQSLNTNMKKGVINQFESLPEQIQERIILNDFKPFETLRNTLLNMKGNNKDERERESYIEMFERISVEFIIPEGYAELLLLWFKYKSEKNQSYKETGMKLFISKTLRDFTKLADFKGAIDSSISKNYSGLFPDNSRQKGKDNTLNSAPTNRFKAKDDRPR